MNCETLCFIYFATVNELTIGNYSLTSIHCYVLCFVNIQALGSLYFIHSSVSSVKIFDFQGEYSQWHCLSRVRVMCTLLYLVLLTVICCNWCSYNTLLYLVLFTVIFRNWCSYNTLLYLVVLLTIICCNWCIYKALMYLFLSCCGPTSSAMSGPHRRATI